MICNCKRSTRSLMGGVFLRSAPTMGVSSYGRLRESFSESVRNARVATVRASAQHPAAMSALITFSTLSVRACHQIRVIRFVYFEAKPGRGSGHCASIL
jgi:hypothetical protein